jgi:hypothetical protein
MKYGMEQAAALLSRTPKVLGHWLSGLADEWVYQKPEGEEWSPFDVVGHLAHGEKTDWIPRMRIILSDGDKKFAPFDRLAQFKASKGKSIDDVLVEFASLRERNLQELNAANLSGKDLDKTGIHPEFGEVTLRQHLSTWVTHDLAHISQIARIMAKQYKQEVGPWVKYIGVLRK